MSQAMKCVNCNQTLEQLIDGDEWVSPDGAIFCAITDEIHNRVLKPIDEQAERIRENMKADLAYALETGDLQMFEDIFEDRDPFEFL